MSRKLTPKCVSFNVIQGETKTNALISDNRKNSFRSNCIKYQSQNCIKTKKALELLFHVNLAMTQSLDSCSFFLENSDICIQESRVLLIPLGEEI